MEVMEAFLVLTVEAKLQSFADVLQNQVLHQVLTSHSLTDHSSLVLSFFKK